MNINARRTPRAGRWAGAIALCIGLGTFTSAQGSPIPFKATGRFELSGGPADLSGTSAEWNGPMVVLGTIPVGGNHDALGDAPFRLKLAFEGLPDIDVRGMIPSIGYNPDLPVQHAIVTTTATPAQIGLYPDLFQRLIAHPEWMHTTSFRGPRPDMEIGLSVHPEDLGAIRPVPEPSSALIVAAAFAGLVWRARRRSSPRRGG